MKQRASYAIAGMVSDEELTEDNIIPSPLNKAVADVVAKAVADVAVEEGIARFKEYNLFKSHITSKHRRKRPQPGLIRLRPFLSLIRFSSPLRKEEWSLPLHVDVGLHERKQALLLSELLLRLHL